ncbi:asparaginyl-tRNA synthetase [Artomyces pyxidatus]|uniref:Asparaginyl-tRNA synthetase n=1 Tax=Artomyces pyxidatus TaxID=48021 RepID=A0ACB8TF32_9AGAM|nr:asparaginyl-tRNA synthetase [Artomyces pyxidatus]
MSRVFASALRTARLGKTVRQVLASTPTDELVQVNGWVRSVRLQKRVAFAMVHDGTCTQSLQVVFPDPRMPHRLTNGASVRLTGRLSSSPGPGQAVELLAESLDILGECDPVTYPIQKQTLSSDYLRDHAHLRLRTDSPGAVLRLRGQAMQALHRYFERHDFTYAHTPILTSSDAEGAGETFRVAPLTSPGSTAGAPAHSYEFFAKPAYLTVSSQLHLEAIASAVARTWTLSPCFRAERSQTNRHLAEFWMLEAEWAFVDSVAGLTQVVEDALKEVLRLNTTERRLLWKDADSDKHALLEEAAGDAQWAHMTYDAAIRALQLREASSGVKFQFPPVWGHALQSEHERWLADELVCGPVFVTDYPAALKPFYMRLNDDGKTVACFDLLVPGIGELVGGSLREERLELLEAALERHGMDKEAYRWYLELRKFGGAPHGGFGLGFERLISWIGGIDNVRECIPMPRWAGRMLL